MTLSPNRNIANMEGASALPRKNGELVFEAPWEGRVFGIAVALGDEGLYEWRDFSQRLAAEIADTTDESRSSYYEQWLAALEKLALEKGFVTGEELDRRTDEFASGRLSA